MNVCETNAVDLQLDKPASRDLHAILHQLRKTALVDEQCRMLFTLSIRRLEHRHAGDISSALQYTKIRKPNKRLLIKRIATKMGLLSLILMAIVSKVSILMFLAV